MNTDQLPPLPDMAAIDGSGYRYRYTADQMRSYAAQAVAAERATAELEPVGWQQRFLCPEEGPGIWVFCDDSTAEILARKPLFELRRVYVRKGIE